MEKPAYLGAGARAVRDMWWSRRAQTETPETKFWREYTNETDQTQQRLFHIVENLLAEWDNEFQNTNPDYVSAPPPSQEVFATLQRSVEACGVDLLNLKRHLSSQPYRLSNAQMKKFVVSVAILSHQLMELTPSSSGRQPTWFWDDYIDENQQSRVRMRCIVENLLVAWENGFHKKFKGYTDLSEPSPKVFADLQEYTKNEAEDLLDLKERLSKGGYRLSNAQLQKFTVSVTILAHHLMEETVHATSY